jgi:hypothetical protein
MGPMVLGNAGKTRSEHPKLHSSYGADAHAPAGVG